MIEIEAAKASYLYTNNQKFPSQTWLSLRFQTLLVHYLQRVHAALAESSSVADMKGLRTFTTFFIIFPSLSVILFFSVWCVTSYQVDKDLKKRLSDNLRRRTDSMEDFENYTVATLLDNRYKKPLLSTTLTCASVISVFIHSKTLQIWKLSLKFTGF